MRRLLVLWLPLAACSNHGLNVEPPPDGSARAIDAGGSAEVFAAASPGSLDADADLGLDCTDATPSFTASVAPILAGCSGGEVCHGFASPPYLYGQLVGAPAVGECDAGVLVAPGSLKGSYLLHKLTGIGMCPNTGIMPPGGALSPANIQTIADWICSGAPND